MDTADALAQLTELSTDVLEVVAVATDGSREAHVGATIARADELARAGTELIARAEESAPVGARVARVQVERAGGGLFVVAEHGRLAVATTVAEATAGLVVHDLRTVLRRSAPPEAEQ
jgi:hypothetical protein